MPWTINGCGTSYVGRANRETRQGLCTTCGKRGVLTARDTRLWFTLVFVPVVPLAKKRIRDECAHCRYSYVLDHAEWLRSSGQLVDAAKERVQTSPRDAEAVIQLHATLIHASKYTDAAALANAMGKHFAADSRVQVYLAALAEDGGDRETASAGYQHALKLDPESPIARAAVGLDLARAGQLDEAYELLRFMESPEAIADRWALDELAAGFGRAGRHAEELRTLRLLISHFPAAAYEKPIRKRVARSAKAAGESAALPSASFDWRTRLGWDRHRFVVATVLCGLVFIVCANIYTAFHRTLYLVNGFDAPLTIEIDGSPPLMVPPFQHSQIELSEGSHCAQTTGAFVETIPFSIEAQHWFRLSDCTAYVLNPGNAAVLGREHITYRDTRYAPTGVEESGYEILFGGPLLVCPAVDFPFREFPISVTADGSSGSTVKSRLELLRMRPRDAIRWLADASESLQATNMAEWYLAENGDDASIHELYTRVAARTPGGVGRARAFLQKQIGVRPIRIHAHYAWQDVRATEADPSALVAEYDALLAADPASPACLCLRARLSTTWSDAVPYYQTALEIDPDCVPARYELASGYCAQGDWRRARPHLVQVLERDPFDERAADLLRDVRLALGEATDLQAESRAQLDAYPDDLAVASTLVSLLAADRDRDAASKVVEGFPAALKGAISPQERMAVRRQLQERSLYASGDLGELVRMEQSVGTPESPSIRFYALVELGQPVQALQVAPNAVRFVDDPYSMLAVAIAFADAGIDDHARAWKKRAIDNLRTSNRATASVARMLSAESCPETADVIELPIHFRDKAILSLWLAQTHRDRRAEFLPLARRLNAKLSFPHHMIDRMTAANSG